MIRALSGASRDRRLEIAPVINRGPNRVDPHCGHMNQWGIEMLTQLMDLRTMTGKKFLQHFSLRDPVRTAIRAEGNAST